MKLKDRFLFAKWIRDINYDDWTEGQCADFDSCDNIFDALESGWAEEIKYSDKKSCLDAFYKANYCYDKLKKIEMWLEDEYNVNKIRKIIVQYTD